MNIVTTQQHNASRNNLDDSMIPAINIVFLLLIFFMLAGHIEAQDAQLQIPASSSETELNSAELEIHIAASGGYTINGQASQQSLADYMNGLVLTPDTVVICRIHRDLPSSALDPVLQAVQQFGIKTLSIATEQH
ncbi:biopolymer transporter ExbD [Amphritea sp. 1_MG-2023]|uniref:ExbD/TolR family protein n=1 Tax=Amphritea sp. 1_MG-2023 TaxID=3062670 RepID=UPI0026E3FCA6|nr:biopolymer transporter ExbD [Amphritea sp. 1_MG-2023]MDO6564138.1 biopolymer transporter ExbD [Amphritea sp. 1_MG-2023]